MAAPKAAGPAVDLTDEPRAHCSGGDPNKRTHSETESKLQPRRGGRRSRDKGNRLERALSPEGVLISTPSVDRDLLVVKADRRVPLVVLPIRLAIEIAQAAERSKAVAS